MLRRKCMEADRSYREIGGRRGSFLAYKSDFVCQARTIMYQHVAAQAAAQSSDLT